MITIPLYFGNFLALLSSIAILLILAYCIIEVVKFVFVKVLALDTPHAPKFKFTNGIELLYNTLLKCKFLYIRRSDKLKVSMSSEVPSKYIITRRVKSGKNMFDANDSTWGKSEYNGCRFDSAHEAEEYILNSLPKTKCIDDGFNITNLIISLSVYALTLDVLLFMFQYASIATIVFVGVVILCFTIRKMSTFMYKKFYTHDVRIKGLEDAPRVEDSTPRNTGRQHES